MPPSSPASPELTFLGAAGTVTGSRHLVRHRGESFLLDCGLFQGLKALRLRNWAEPPAALTQVTSVVLSHAHLDHSGYLPLLVRRGFRGDIHCTQATRDLLEVLLLDSGRIQEEDAARANRRQDSKHQPALPLYTVADAEAALRQVRTHGYGEPFAVGAHAQAVFRRSGHILGSAWVELELSGGARPLRVVYTGDLGRPGRPILQDPEPARRADVLLVEGTYGNRLHPPAPEETLARVVTETAARGGVLVIPAFAVGRTQELLWTLQTLEQQGRLPMFQVALDSPMAQRVSALYCAHHDEHDAEMRQRTARKLCPLCSGRYRRCETAEQSRALNAIQGPLVILAGSGMATGGRVLHHLRYRLPDHRNTVLLVGYQAAGTRGRALQDGKPTVRIHGQDVPVRARVETLDGLSAHADQGEILRWLEGFEAPPAQTWVVHAEPEAGTALQAAIADRLGWNVAVAEDGATVPLGSEG